MRTALLVVTLVVQMIGVAVTLPFYRWRAVRSFRRGLRKHGVPAQIADELCQAYKEQILKLGSVSGIMSLARR